MRVIEIWQPRYHDGVVLIACHKVTDGWNYLRFTKAPSLKGVLYQFNGTSVRDLCEVQSNGKILCFVVPMSMLMEVEQKEK